MFDLIAGGQSITTTPGHPFSSIDRRAWVGAGELRIGERLRAGDGAAVSVEGKSPLRGELIELYNIEVEELHTYFVGGGRGVLVHNGFEGNCGIPKPAAATGEGAIEAERRTLYHYTNARGHEGIVSSEQLRPSLKAANPKDVRYGEGQYLSDIVPGTKTPGQLAYAFLNDPRGWRRFTHYIEIDVTGLPVTTGRPRVFVIPNTSPLDLLGRIVGHGPVPGP